MAVSFAACADDPQALAHEHEQEAIAFSKVGAGQLDGLAKQVRQVTSRFNSRTQATQAGYAEASPCVAAPGLGGMGFHWVNGGIVDPVFEPLQPEAVLYAPTPNGKLELVAVEYIVINVGQPAPTFDGQPFDVGGTPVPVPHWSLHVWAHKENPNGLFTPFNPSVTCP
jgi:hypothetical protein